MKIVYINSFYAPDEVGGAEKSVRFLAEEMVQQGHNATVITLGRARETTALNGVAIERLPIRNIYFPTDSANKSALEKLTWHSIDSFNPFAAHDISKILDKANPDVIHTNNLAGFSASTLIAIKKRKIPVVHTLRDYYFLCPNTAMFKDGKSCEQRCLKCQILSTPRAIASQDVNIVVGNSKFILDKHLSLGLFKNAERKVIYNAYTPKSNEDIRPIDTTNFGFIGRLAPTKGIEILIEAVRILATETNQRFRVKIAGDGPQDYLSKLKGKAAGLPIDFLGRTTPEQLYNQVHWTVLPSIWDEPLARVIFESYAHGVPVIGSQTGGTPELLEEDVTGYIYSDARNPTNLKEKMAKALTNNEKYKSMVSESKKQSQNFTPEAVSKNYLTLYKIAKNTNPPPASAQ